MKIKRRVFLVASVLGGFGLAGLGNILRGKISGGTDTDVAIASVPKPPEPPLLRFGSLGDTGMGNDGQYAIAEAMTRYHQQNPFNLAILAGDNIYNNGEIAKIGKVFEEPYRQLLNSGVKFQACLGNHDIRINNGNDQVKYAGFNMQGRYYTFSREPVQFFALDTNHNADWDAQMKWLGQELSRSKAVWKVVFGHHPLYSSGMHGGDRNLIRRLSSLFQTYRVQLYINGHDHNYERTNPINGTTYLTCGGGAGTRLVGRSDWTARAAKKLSFAAFDVYADQIIVSGIDADNRLFDQVAIQLSPG